MCEYRSPKRRRDRQGDADIYTMVKRISQYPHLGVCLFYFLATPRTPDCLYWIYTYEVMLANVQLDTVRVPMVPRHMLCNTSAELYRFLVDRAVYGEDTYLPGN